MAWRAAAQATDDGKNQAMAVGAVAALPFRRAKGGSFTDDFGVAHRGDWCTLHSECDTATGRSKTPASRNCRGVGRAAGIRWTEGCQVQSDTGVFWREAEL